MKDQELIRLAKEARTHAYVPYSHYSVGAALECGDGTVYQGCNIENASYGVSNCGERTALFRAVYDGHRDFTAIAIVGGPEGMPINSFAAPCGICRQALREFTDPDTFRILLTDTEDPDGPYSTYTLSELLPLGFTKSSMK